MEVDKKCMGIFSKKEKSESLKKLEQFKSTFSGLITVDKYISRSDLKAFKIVWQEFFTEINAIIKANIIEEYCDYFDDHETDILFSS